MNSQRGLSAVQDSFSGIRGGEAFAQQDLSKQGQSFAAASMKRASAPRPALRTHTAGTSGATWNAGATPANPDEPSTSDRRQAEEVDGASSFTNAVKQNHSGGGRATPLWIQENEIAKFLAVLQGAQRHMRRKTWPAEGLPRSVIYDTIIWYLEKESKARRYPIEMSVSKIRDALNAKNPDHSYNLEPGSTNCQRISHVIKQNKEKLRAIDPMNQAAEDALKYFAAKIRKAANTNIRSPESDEVGTSQAEQPQAKIARLDSRFLAQ